MLSQPLSNAMPRLGDFEILSSLIVLALFLSAESLGSDDSTCMMRKLPPG